MCLHVCLLFKISSQYAIQPFHHSFALPTLKGKSKQEDQGWGVQGVINGFMYVFIYCAENSNFFPNMGTKITKFFQINRLTLCQPPPLPPSSSIPMQKYYPPPNYIKTKTLHVYNQFYFWLYNVSNHKKEICEVWQVKKQQKWMHWNQVIFSPFKCHKVLP